MPRPGFLLLLVTLLVWSTDAQRQGCSSSADFIFILDSSGSLEDQSQRTNNWGFIQDYIETAVLNIADDIEDDYTGASSGLRFGLVQFRDVGVITVGLDDFPNFRDAADVMGRATNLGGPTNMEAGLLEAEKMLAPRRNGNVRNTVLIVVSDWNPFNDTVRRYSIDTARRLESQYNVTIVTVGVMFSVDRQFLMDVATNGRNVMSENHGALLNYISPLINVVCESPNQGSGGGGLCERDIVFVIDASLSQQREFDRLKDFVARVAGNIYQTTRDTRMGVVTFSSDARVSLPLQLYSDVFATQIRAIDYNYQLTNPADALRKARDMLAGSTRTRTVIVFTDGLTTEEQGQETIIARDMRDDGIIIIAFGVSNSIDYATLEKLVGRDKRNTNIFWSSDYQTNMIAKLNSLTQTAESCPVRDIPCDVRPPEVILALDASGSIKDKGVNNWALMQDFGVAVVETLRRAYPDSRVGVLTFSDTAQEIIGLTRDTTAVVTAIRAAKHINGYTNEADAFARGGAMLRNARDPSYQYFIMVTDGQPTLRINEEIEEAAELERRGILRIMIGVTTDIEEDRLRALGSSPPERYVVFTRNFDTLNAPGLISSVVTAAGQCQGPQPTRAPTRAPTRRPTAPPRQCFGADVILIMDSSGSIEEKGRGNFDLLKTFTRNLVESISMRYTETRFGLVIFSDEGILVSSLNDYRSVFDFLQTINAQQYSGFQTNIASAIRVARADALTFQRNNPQIILITDGEPTAERNFTIPEAVETRRRNIRISAVGITRDVNEDTLERITGDRNRVYTTPNFRNLQNDIVDVTQVACQGSRAGSPCSGEVEVVFALDASGSILDLSDTAWNDALDLVKAATKAFYTFNRNTRFGLVIFSDRARTEFRLSNDMENIERKVHVASYDRGRTNIAEGIEVARQDVFSDARSGASKILIIITDGTPNERINDTVPQANLAKRENIVIVPVGITQNGPDYDLLELIASNSQQVIRSLSFASLNREIGRLIQASCVSFQTTRVNPNVINVFTTRPVRNGNNFPLRTTRVPLFRQTRTTPFVVFALQAGQQRCSGGHIVLVIDVSTRLHFKTLPDRGIEGLREMAANIVEVLSRQHRDAKFAVVTYSRTATVAREFSAYRNAAELQTYLQGLDFAYVYESNIADGFSKAKDAIERAGGPRSMVVLISDGEATLDQGIEQTRAAELRNMRHKVLVIAVSKNTQQSQLDAITQRDPPNFTAETFRFDANLLRPFYDMVSCRRPNAVAPLRASDEQICADEIVFVVDSSGNMNDNNWDDTKDFLEALVERFTYYTPGTKFGSVLFGNNSMLGFYLSDDISESKMRIRNLRQMGGETNIASGLSAARRYIFNNNDANKLMILLMDGDPTIEIDETYREANRVRNGDRPIDLLVVGITSKPSQDIMERIAGSSQKTVRVHDFNLLEGEVDKVVGFGCRGGDNRLNQQQTQRPPTP